MTSIVFAVCIALLIVEVSIAQEVNLTLPVNQPIRAIEGGSSQTCPPAEISDSVRNQLKEETGSILREIGPILDFLFGDCRNSYGRIAQCPATSCSDVVEQSATLPLSGYFWIQTSNGNVVQAYCDTTRGVCNDSAIYGLYEFCPSESCNGIGFRWIQHENGSVSQVLCPAANCSEVFKNDPSATRGYYPIRLPDGTITQLYCEMSPQCSCSNNDGEPFTRVAFVNMTDNNQQCPGDFVEVSNSAIRACRRDIATTPVGCTSAFFSAMGIEYKYVCGRVLAWELGNPAAFYNHWHHGHGIDSRYVEGISITYGGPPRQHIWTLVGTRWETYTSSATQMCPCSHTSVTNVNVPQFIGNDYFCETGLSIANAINGRFYEPTEADPLWDGEGCGSTSTCCQFNNPPWFCKELSTSTTEDIEVRMCDGHSYDDTPFELLELYVR